MRLFLMSSAIMIAAIMSDVASAVPNAVCFNPLKPVIKPVSVTSGKTAVNVIELFTSEGCDSCPPADKWFSTLPAADTSTIPLAFHVDYWDYIGWKDRFAKPGYAQRQREEVTRQGSRTVYTPQFLLNGKDWRNSGLSTASGGNLLGSLASRPAEAMLALVASIEASASPSALAPSIVTEKSTQLKINLQVNIPDANARKESAVFIAISENNLISRVTAGENRGLTLKHDHVVRELIGPISVRLDGTLDIVRNIPIASDWKLADINIVAFVQNQRDGETLQAITSPLCR